MMTKLPWQHGRSRTKSGSEKNGIGGPHDWFSRTTSEPSRQALTELVKQHKREQSDGSNGNSPKSRLRSNTANSQERAIASRGRSDSDDVGNNSWYPVNVYDDAASFTTEKMEGTAKALLNKSSFMLRRRGSKLSLSSNGSSSTLGFTSPSRTHSINVSTSRRTSRDDMRNKISAPFDFQHVTHTEQTQFAGLGRIDESELAHRFSALAVEQRSSDGLKGIEASHIHTHAVPHDSGIRNPMTITNTDSTSLSTLPPPRPPPKDEPNEHLVTSEIYLPKALYSPLQLSPISMSFPRQCSLPGAAVLVEAPLPVNPTQCLSGATPGIDSQDNPLASKPLPQLPVIHAVTTEDDSARALIAAPLPTPPGSISPASEIDPFTSSMAHQRQKSSIALPRHYTLYPSSKSSMPNLLSADRVVKSINTLSRHHSDMALSRQVRDYQAPLSTRTSMSFAAVDTMDWEAAVDEAWDADLDLDDEQAADPAYVGKAKRQSPLIDTLFAEQNISAGSTPLMMAHSQRSNSTGPERVSPVLGSDFHKLDSVQEDECSVPLSGLGISSFSSANTAEGSFRDSASSDAQFRRSQSSVGSAKQPCLTRSSSQESVIYSLASSIMETQRSSKSSVFTNDISKKIEDLDMVAEASGEDSEPNTVQSRIRPESGCLPSDILDQYQLILSSGRQEVSHSTFMPQSDRGSRKSASKITVPERRSSILPSSRSRSNTVGGPTRQNSRVSYSLFPTAQPLISAPISS